MLKRIVILAFVAVVSWTAAAQATTKPSNADASNATPAQLAAAAKLPLVQDNLAVIYAEGRGVPQDYAKAAEWFQKAADQGDAFAEYSLAYLYSEGLGVTKNYTQAAKWYYKSAMQGDAKSQYNLGTLYYLGVGVPKSHVVALDWFKQAAARGDKKAQYYLATLRANATANAHAPASPGIFDSAQQAFADEQDDSQAPEKGLGLIYLQGAGASVGYEALFALAAPLLAGI